MSKRAIILGGAGLIGSHLTVRLLRDGYEVVCIDNRNRDTSPLLCNLENRNRFHYIKHDITTPYQIGCDELYNLVAAPKLNGAFDILADQRLITSGSINSLELTKGNKTKVLYASADDVYNFDNRDINYSSHRRFIAENKRFGESIHMAYHAQCHTDIRIARIFTTYGANAGLCENSIVGKMIVKALSNHDITIHGSGDQIRTFCWVGDMVEGLIKLMRAHVNDQVLITDLGSNSKITILELAKLIISLTGSKSHIKQIYTRKDEVPYKVPNLEIAKEELQWEAATPLIEGLQRTISYIEKELSAIALQEMSWIEMYT